MERFIERECSSYFYIDDSRRRFIQDTEETLSSLVNGKLLHRTHFRRLLLGRKGTGKSTLLEVIGKAAKSVYKEQLTVCDVEFLNPTFAVLPSTLIAMATGAEQCLPVRIKVLDDLLDKNKKFVLFVVDELDQIFRSDSAIGKQIIGELAEIGNSSKGRVHCIISGSSSRLRQLCFSKLPNKDKAEFPNYEGIDLNSTKFSARWIHPFLGKNDFINVFRILHENDYDQLDESEKVKLYILTGGNGRHMAEKDVSLNTYSVSLKNFSDSDMTLLKALFTSTRDFMSRFEEALDKVSNFTRYIPLSTVLHELSGTTFEDLLPTLYNLADRGLLRFKDYQDKSGHGHEVSLGTPLIYLQLANMNNCDLTAQEAAALICPEANQELSGEVAMRFLLPKAYECGIGHQLKRRHVKQRQLYINSAGSTDDPNIVNLNSTSKEDLTSYFYKEQPDAYGADAVIHEVEENGTMVAHRIQLKLGRKRIDLQEAEKIANRFSTHEKTIEFFYSQCGIEGLKQKFYLVSTRSLAPAEREFLTNRCITTIDAAMLREVVWPDVVKGLGKPYN